MCTRHSFCAPGMTLTIIPDSSVQAMKAGDGDEVIHTSLIHRPSFVFVFSRVVQMLVIWLWPLEGMERNQTLRYHICNESQSVNTLGDALADVYLCILCV